MILATFAPMTKASKENKVVLERVLCIYYSLHFQKNTAEVKALINSDSKINAIILTYAAQLRLWVR